MKKIRWRRMIVLTIFFTLVAILQALYDYLLVRSEYSEGVSNIYQIKTVLTTYILSGVLGGALGGFTLNYVDEKLREAPYYKSLALIVFIFFTLFFFHNVVVATIESINNPDTPFHLEMNLIDIKDLLFWAPITILAYFLIQMSNKFGPGKLFKIFIGKYNIPKLEKRIFMFIDLKSSTKIAEELGGIRYHLLLRKIFADLTAPILNNKGEIYQYVGDEIIISWEMNAEDEKKDHFLNCFFSIQDLLKENAIYFEQNFGIQPEFKAGAHIGEVIVGEIGVIKREVTYSGDVLNTTARIQGSCNELNSNLLISEELHNYYLSSSTKPSKNFRTEFKGKTVLKGKKKPMELLSISRIEKD